MEYSDTGIIMGLIISSSVLFFLIFCVGYVTYKKFESLDEVLEKVFVSQLKALNAEIKIKKEFEEGSKILEGNMIVLRDKNNNLTEELRIVREQVKVLQGGFDVLKTTIKN